MSEPDLFVICKNCSSEVSPYVTECPYCGQRVRRRAPRIERPDAPESGKGRKGRRPPSLPKLRRDEIPGIAPETRPYATAVLICASLLATVVLAVRPLLAIDLEALGPLGSEWWKLFSSPLLHDGNAGYQFVALLAVALFGTHLERRFGALAPPIVFVLAGAAGVAASSALGMNPALGANGAALGLLCAWLVDDRRALRRGEDRESDLLGVYVFAAVLILLSVAEPTASLVAALAGAATGAVAGLVVSTLRR